MRSKISSKLIFATCVWYSDHAHYELCILTKDIGRRLPLQLQCPVLYTPVSFTVWNEPHGVNTSTATAVATYHITLASPWIPQSACLIRSTIKIVSPWPERATKPPRHSPFSDYQAGHRNTFDWVLTKRLPKTAFLPKLASKGSCRKIHYD